MGIDKHVDAFQTEERGVPLVHVANLRMDPHRSKGFHAPDTQDDLLSDPGFTIAAVQFVRDILAFEPVRREVGVKEI